MRNQYKKRHAQASQSDSLNYEEIYSSFLTEVIKTQSIWGIATHHWTICTNASGHKAMPLWAKESDAQLSCFGSWQTSEAKSISLVIFMTKLIPYLLEHNMLIAINRNVNGEAIFVHPERIQAELIPVQ